MVGRRTSIGFVMRLTAIIAVSLALLRAAPIMTGESPLLCYFFVAIELVLVQAVALGRPVGTFHYTFLVVGALSSGVVTVIALYQSGFAPGSLHILGGLMESCLATLGTGPAVSVYARFPILVTADRWVTCIIALLPACAAGLIVSRRIDRPGRSWGKATAVAAAFFQGLVVGLGLFTIATTLVFHFGSGAPDPHTNAWYLLLVGEIASPLVGGFTLAAMARAKTAKRGGDGFARTAGGAPAVLDQELSDQERADAKHDLATRAGIGR